MRQTGGMLLVAPTDVGIRLRLADELAGVEGRFATELLSDLPCVNSLVTHVERYRGKMLRPMLVLASGMAANPQAELRDAHRVLAAVVEMVHMATLVHDDILDEAEIRRRGSTINHLRGNEAAVMLGDYLISHAYHLCSSLDSVLPSRAIAEATNIVCEGELLQLANRDNWELDEGTYFEIIRRKTASLCGTCCRLGAQMSQTNGEVAEGLYNYGERVGVAFQIIDDLLDLTGSQDTVGKTLGRDLEKGKLTLPVIHHLRVIGEVARRQFIEQVRGRGGAALPPAQMERLRQAMVATGSVQHATAAARRLIEQAKAALAPLAESRAKALLLEMADAVLTRKF